MAEPSEPPRKMSRQERRFAERQAAKGPSSEPQKAKRATPAAVGAPPPAVPAHGAERLGDGGRVHPDFILCA
jgi:hypothetical protein